jgi:hypothetical protein
VPNLYSDSSTEIATPKEEGHNVHDLKVLSRIHAVDQGSITASKDPGTRCGIGAGGIISGRLMKLDTFMMR